MPNNKPPENILPQTSVRQKYQRLYELVAEQLTDWIMDGTLKAGERLNTDEICEKLGVSRMPVRDALKILEESGLITNTPYLGATVASISMEDILELFVMRMSLEPAAAYHAVKKITDAQIGELRDIQNKLDAAINMEAPLRDTKQIYRYNRLFHQTLYSFSGMKRLCKTIDGILNSLAYVRIKNVYESSGNLGFIKLEHQSFLEQIEKRDANKVSALLHSTLSDHYARLEKVHSEQ